MFEEGDILKEQCTPLRAVVWRGDVYRPGDHVVVLLDGSEDATNPLNWKAKVTSFFMHEFKGHMNLFFEAEWYHNLVPVEGVSVQYLRDDYSQFILLHPKPYMGWLDNCKPVSRIMHKYFPIHRNRAQGGQEVVALEIGDSLYREVPKVIASPPPYPEVGDIIRAKRNSTNVAQLCVIREVILPCVHHIPSRQEDSRVSYGLPITFQRYYRYIMFGV